jgi:hypothetical protein
MKKSAKVVQYFGFDCGTFVTFSTNEPFSKEQLLTLPHFWSPVWQKRLRFVPKTFLPKKYENKIEFFYKAA